MTRTLLAVAALAALATPSFAQEDADAPPSPNQIVEQAAAEEWVKIAPEDLLVMTLAPDVAGNERIVVIQLIPPPFSQGWVENIRTLARAGWYDGITVNRVQDNYVVQWGDTNYDNPEATGEAKPLPEGLKLVPEKCYSTDFYDVECGEATAPDTVAEAMMADTIANMEAAVDSVEELNAGEGGSSVDIVATRAEGAADGWHERDSYADWVEFYRGWPLGGEQSHEEMKFWPVHCYCMVGVGRGYSPDTGSGAELYTVIGHAPRHLDRNIALVGRVVEGIEHLSSLPRGKGQLGFYEDAEQRTPIFSIRVASDLPPDEQPSFEYLSTEGETFARYAEARANRRDPFFIVPAGGADICNIPVPIRRVGV